MNSGSWNVLFYSHLEHFLWYCNLSEFEALSWEHHDLAFIRGEQLNIMSYGWQYGANKGSVIRLGAGYGTASERKKKKKKNMTEIAAKMVHGWFDWWPVWHLSSKRYWGLKGRGRRILLSRHLILHWSKRCISSRLNYANSQLGPAPVTVTVCGCVCVGVWSFS